MNKQLDIKGFTFIELLIVMGIMAMLIVLSAPFVSSLSSDIDIQRSIRQVKVDLVSVISYSLAGKSFAALSADDQMNPDLIPAAYSLYFEVDNYGDQKPYKYLELTAEEEGLSKAMKLSYEMDHDYESSTVYLKEITLKNSNTGTSKSVNSAYIMVLPPFGKLLFVDENKNFLSHLNEDDFYQNQREFDEINLLFQYKDDEITETILSLNSSKIINIL